MQVPEEGQSSLGPGAKATDGCEHLIQALGFTEILRRITTAFTTEPSLQLSVLWDYSPKYIIPSQSQLKIRET